MTILLSLLAAHDGQPSLEALIADMAEERAEAIGLKRLFRAARDLDDDFLQGREEASRLVHTQEVGSSILPPATSHNPESEEGPEGVPRGALRSPPVPP